MSSDRVPKAFISYSWDGPFHEQWVMQLANDLRTNRIDATIDKFMTQTQTVNLNTMMVQSLRTSDYVIVVLTENYAKRGDQLMGGVGFETMLSLSELRRNPDKFIFVVRHNGRFEDAVPFHLKDYYSIDFSDSSLYEEKLEELLRRIYKEPRYKPAPLGEKPTFQPVETKPQNFRANVTPSWNISIPKKFTDEDRHRFMNESFTELCAMFHDLFAYVQQQNSTITVAENQSDRDYDVKLFVHGDARTGLRMWKDQLGVSETINLSYGVHQWAGSSNEILQCTYDQKQGPSLEMTMHMFGDKPTTIRGIVETIWTQYVEPSLRR